MNQMLLKSRRKLFFNFSALLEPSRRQGGCKVEGNIATYFCSSVILTL